MPFGQCSVLARICMVFLSPERLKQDSDWDSFRFHCHVIGYFYVRRAQTLARIMEYFCLKGGTTSLV